MPRQTFATRAFFEEATEACTLQAIMQLPQFYNKLQLLTEDEKRHRLVFFYEQELQDAVPIHISISVLPLNDACTKITVHGYYTNDAAFYHDVVIENALDNVAAALKYLLADNRPESFEPLMPKKSFRSRWLLLRPAAVAMMPHNLKK